MIRLKSLLLEQWGEKSANANDTRSKTSAEIQKDKQAAVAKAKKDLADLEAKKEKLKKEKKLADDKKKADKIQKDIEKQNELKKQKADELKQKADELKKQQEKSQKVEKDANKARAEYNKERDEKEAELKKKKEKEAELKKKKEKEAELKKKKPGYPPDEDLPSAYISDNWFGPISATGNGYEPRGHDAFGHGHWRASRKNSDGSTRPHRGLDIKSKAGDPVFSPMDCKIKRVYGIYPAGYKQNKCKYLIGVILEGTGEYSGYVFRLFYVKLASGYKVGQQIKKGDAFAIMQDLENRCYPPKKNGRRMTNHIHWEYYKNKYVKGKDRNPVPLIDMKKPD